MDKEKEKEGKEKRLQGVGKKESGAQERNISSKSKTPG